MANPFVKINPDPLWLNADGIPDGLAARRPISTGRDGAPGVVRRADYAVTFNAGMGITVSGGEAFVAGGDATNQGLYYCFSDASKNITLNAAPTSGTSRVDQVILRVFDNQHDSSGLSEGRLEVIEGAATASANLDANRDSAITPIATQTPSSKSYILLADILVVGGSASLVSSNIRDRRPYCTEGGVSALITANDTLVERATPRPHPAIPLSMRPVAFSIYNSKQAAALVWLDRTISSNKLIFNYRTDTPAPTGGSYMAAVCDASGRLIFNANSQNISTTANSRIHDVMTMPLTTFTVGYYWYVFGLSGATGVNPFYYNAMFADVDETGSGARGAQVMAANVFLQTGSGGATFPSTRTILGYADAFNGSAGALPVPIFELGR